MHDNSWDDDVDDSEPPDWYTPLRQALGGYQPRGEEHSKALAKFEALSAECVPAGLAGEDVLAWGADRKQRIAQVQAELDDFERLHDEARLRDVTSAHLFAGRALLTAFGWESPAQAIARLTRSIERLSRVQPSGVRRPHARSEEGMEKLSKQLLKLLSKQLSKQLKEAEQSAALLERAAVRAAAAQEGWDLVGPERFEVIGRALVDAVASAEPIERIVGVVQAIAEDISDVAARELDDWQAHASKLSRAADFLAPVDADDAAIELIESDPRYLAHPVVAFAVSTWYAARVRQRHRRPTEDPRGPRRALKASRALDYLERVSKAIMRTGRSGPPPPEPGEFRARYKQTARRVEGALAELKEARADGRSLGPQDRELLASVLGLEPETVTDLANGRIRRAGAIRQELELAFDVSDSKTVRKWIRAFVRPAAKA